MTVKEEYEKFYNKSMENKKFLVNDNPFFKVTDNQFDHTHTQLFFSGNIWDHKIKTMFEQDGIKTIQPIALDDRNKSLCSSKMTWLQRMFFSNIVKLNPTFSVELKFGETIALKCPFCNNNKSKTNLWFKKRFKDDANFENLVGDMHSMEADNRIIILADHTLVIKNFRNEDTGTYICIDSELFLNLTSKKTQTEQILSNYYKKNVFGLGRFNSTNLNTSSNETILALIFKINYNLFITDKLFEKERSIIVSDREDSDYLNRKDNKSGLSFTVEWGDWGFCSMCGMKKDKKSEKYIPNEGIKKRFGDCRVKYEENNASNKSKFLKEINRIHYPFGWPCNFGLHEEYVSSEILHEIPPDIVQMKTCTANCTVDEEERRKKGVH
jgi:hypothetical protein